MRSVILFLPVLFLIISCSNSFSEVREEISLAGTWALLLDEEGNISSSQIFETRFNDSVTLPGSLDEYQKGRINSDSSDLFLNRRYLHIGPAYYKKQISIPESWQGKFIRLVMERTKVTDVWIDTTHLGTNNNIYSKQEYLLPEKLTSGEHTLIIKVDNNPDLVPVIGSHAYSENTQTNWNGIIGEFKLEALNKTHLAEIKLTPNIASKTVELALQLSEESVSGLSIQLQAESWNTNQSVKLEESTLPLNSKDQNGTFKLTYSIGEDMQTWSEFDPVLYKMHINLLDGEGRVLDYSSVDFGMREFKANGLQFEINGTKTFLRGKHDACVFPLTGYPAMEKEEWIRQMKISQTYGINHYRFHTWTPPKAAFEAADICGIYMQTELPIWYGLDVNDSAQLAFLIKEGYEILDNYANHASFVMFALGNEIYEPKDTLQRMVSDLRAYDPRPMYAQGSNNHLGNPSYAEGDDYWVSFRTDVQRNDLSSDVRASISHLDAREGGILNTLYPSTSFNYSKALEESPVPVIGFEIGQYSIYPNYDEMKKYTGILDPRNFALFKNKLENAGMMEQANDFFRASGALSVICYKAEIEAALRTPDFGGFHLLDLQDFPGQGTALVGMLDAFMDSKGLIDPSDFRKFCDEITILAELEKHCWTTNETFKVKLVIPNYSQRSVQGTNILWSLQSEAGNVLSSGIIENKNLEQGKVNRAGEINTDLSTLDKAQKVFLQLSVENTAISNEYPVWIYPENLKIDNHEIEITSVLNTNIVSKLKNGARVLYMPTLKSIENKSEANQFISEFWNWGMFTALAERFGRNVSPGTMGLLMNPEHPIFNHFPTEYHTNWQWWSIVKNSRSFILDHTDDSYRPIVQIIDNINRNHKLGLIFEYKVGEGSLLVCTSELSKINKPEAKQLLYSIIEYMKTDAFNPSNKISERTLQEMF